MAPPSAPPSLPILPRGGPSRASPSDVFAGSVVGALTQHEHIPVMSRGGSLQLFRRAGTASAKPGSRALLHPGFRLRRHLEDTGLRRRLLKCKSC